MCTTAFLVEISQYIKFGDLTTSDHSMSTRLDSEPTLPHVEAISLPNGVDDLPPGMERRLSNEEEDALLKDTTASFADWVTNFIRRVIQLLENLPEEGASGIAGGTSEGPSFSRFVLRHLTSP